MTFAFTDPLGNLKVEDSIDLDSALEPGASTELNFACSPRQGETLGIWALDYILESESDTAYTEYDARKVAIGKYVASYNGYSTTPEITYSISSTNDYFAYGSDAVFTVTIWNNGNTDKDVTLKYCFPHHGWIVLTEARKQRFILPFDGQGEPSLLGRGFHRLFQHRVAELRPAAPATRPVPAVAPRA